MSDPVDDLLRRAGAQWRSTQPLAPEAPPAWPARDRRRWPAVLAAAAAVVAVTGTVVALTARPDPAVPTGVVVMSTDGGTTDNNATVRVVRDGDEVEASGLVIAASGEPVRFCAPAPVPAIGRGSALEELLASCPLGVEVTGVDLDALAEAGTTAGVRHGRAYLRGVWHAGTITVTEQGPPVADPQPEPPPLPCPTPEDGWVRGFSPSSNELHEYIEAHADQFRPLWVSYPGGVPGGSMSPAAVEVLVVEVVSGDLAQTTDELRSHYTGNLCVVARPGLPSLAERRRLEGELQPALGALMEDQTNGIYIIGYGDFIFVEMVVLTEPLLAKFAGIDLGAVELRPWVRPVP